MGYDKKALRQLSKNQLISIVLGQEERITTLEQQMLAYENAHTPPSKTRLPRQRRPPTGNPPGRKAGHEGTTRPEPEPTLSLTVTQSCCADCGKALGRPLRFERRVVEETPEPQPVVVTEFLLAVHWCGGCSKEVIATHPACPLEGRFGPRTLTRMTLLHYRGRLPVRRVTETLLRDYGLEMTHSTVLAGTGRVASRAKPAYEHLLAQLRQAPWIYIDETDFNVHGVKVWLWIFETDEATVAVVRHSRGKKVLREILGDDFAGYIISDGHRSYSNFTERRQRCWAHILREADFLAKNIEEMVPFAKALHRLYRKMGSALGAGPPDLEGLLASSRRTLRRWLDGGWAHERVQKFAQKMRADFEKWFTFLRVPGIEPTNNRAERALKEHLVLRKIWGCLRTEQGCRTYEIITSILDTWRKRGENLYQALLNVIQGSPATTPG